MSAIQDHRMTPFSMSVSDTASDGRSEVFFEVIVSTDKPDSVVSGEANTAINPLNI